MPGCRAGHNQRGDDFDGDLDWHQLGIRPGNRSSTFAFGVGIQCAIVQHALIAGGGANAHGAVGHAIPAEARRRGILSTGTTKSIAHQQTTGACCTGCGRGAGRAIGPARHTRPILAVKASGTRRTTAIGLGVQKRARDTRLARRVTRAGRTIAWAAGTRFGSRVAIGANRAGRAACSCIQKVSTRTGLTHTGRGARRAG